MEAHEEAQRRKELMELRDMEDTVGILVSEYLSGRDLRNRGKDIHPSGKEIKFVNAIAASLRSPAQVSNNRRKSGGVDELEGDGDSAIDNSTRGFDLTSGSRIHVNQGYVNKREPDGFLRRTSRRYLFLFTDVLLLTTARKETPETFELNQVFWMRDLRIRNLEDDSNEDEKCAFELIVQKPRNRGVQCSMIFSCDSELSKKNWVGDIESTLLAYHMDTPKLGWFHDLIQGTMYSAAHTGDTVTLRRHLQRLAKTGQSIDQPDNSGMTTLHWAVLAGHEVCVRLLLDYGADVDCLQHGLNTPLLLAAARGHDSILRLLIDRGANIRAKNRRDRDAVFMAVVYGHAAKGLPWVLQVLEDRGLNLNHVDSSLATPLHMCAEKNLARPVRMLVDAGADINAKHGRTSLTPLLMACNQAHPDVETIRSFLDKGAYPNWRDVQGRSACGLIIFSQHSASASRAIRDDGAAWESPTRESEIGAGKWRPMDNAIEEVGDWATNALPALLEITKRGGRFDPRELERMRPSFALAVQEAQKQWEMKVQPPEFLEFVRLRELAGEDLKLTKGGWTKDKTSPTCQLCTVAFGLKLRRHHCRSCGALVCDSCSTKRLQLTCSGGDAATSSSTAASRAGEQERVCDGCFNRLYHESQQPAPDHFRVKQLRQCAIELMNGLGDLVDALDDPDGDPNAIQASLRETLVLSSKLVSPDRRELLGGGRASMSFAATPPRRAASASVEALRLRESKLNKAEDMATKFLEASEGYHRIAKKLVEQKMANSRLWGATF